MSDNDHVKFINPLALVTATAWLASTTAKAQTCPFCETCDTTYVADIPPCQCCDAYRDAEICRDGNTDVTCGTESYAGCNPQTELDCADDPNGNNDDNCCAGLSPFGGEHIDHEYCDSRDAPWGGISWCLPGFDSNPPPDDAWFCWFIAWCAE